MIARATLEYCNIESKMVGRGKSMGGAISNEIRVISQERGKWD